MSDTQTKQLNSLMATGRNDFPVVHLGGISPVLNVLLWLTRMTWSGCEPLSKMTSNLDRMHSHNITGLAGQSVQCFDDRYPQPCINNVVS